MTSDHADLTDRAGASLFIPSGGGDQINLRGHARVECHDADGNLKWVEDIHNLIVTVGGNFLLDNNFRASGYTAAWFIGLKGAGTAALADTMASHGGWAEVTAYSESVRQTLTMAAAASKSSTNSASPAVFSVNGTVTIAGIFITTSNTKSGTTGTLYAATDFSVSRNAVSGDTLTATYTASC